MKQANKLSFYEVNPRFFKDYSGNGIGDLIGLSKKFDYFKHLGVKAIILQNVLSVDAIKENDKSFTTVDSKIGDIKDINNIVSLAKKANQKILIELNIGSVAKEHVWFKSAEKQGPKEYKEVIDFKPEKLHDNIEYKLSSENKKYYPIDSKTQDVKLNWKSEQVITNFIKVIRFWIDLGISGFVFNNFEYVAEEQQKISMSQKTLKELRKFYRAIKEIDDNILVIGKSSFLPITSVSNFTNGATKVFDYFLSNKISEIGLHHKFKQDAIGKFYPRKLVKTLRIYAYNPSNIVSFNSRHLGKVISRWLNDTQFIKESAKTLGTLLLLNKSSSLIYCGDEIGLPNIGLTHLDDFQDRTLNKRKSIAMKASLTEEKFMEAQVMQGAINARSLMPWSSEKNGGFSISEKTITPVSIRYKEINVTNQFKNKKSVLNFFAELNKIAHNSAYSSIIKNGNQTISSPMFGVIKNKITFDSKELLVFANLTSGKKSILLRPKFGKVILSSYDTRDYNNIPKTLDAYETIVIYKKTDDFIKKTKTSEPEELQSKELAKKEKRIAQESKRKARELEKAKTKEETKKARELEKTKLMELKNQKAEKQKKESLINKDKFQEPVILSDNEEFSHNESEEKLIFEAEEKAVAKKEQKLKKAKTKEEARQARELEKTMLMNLKTQKVKKQKKERLINKDKFQEPVVLSDNEDLKHNVKEEKLIFETQENMIENLQMENSYASKKLKKHNKIELKKEVYNQDDNMFDFEKDLNENLKEESHGLKVESMPEKQKSEIDIAKENAKIEKDVADSYKDEKTKLKEEEIAKTTLVDDSFDIDELFGDEDKEKNK